MAGNSNKIYQKLLIVYGWSLPKGTLNVAQTLITKQPKDYLKKRLYYIEKGAKRSEQSFFGANIIIE